MNEFNEKNFTRKPDLAANDGLTCYLGQGAQQNLTAFNVFYNFLYEIRPKRILEVGTGLGGFTYFLKLTIDELELDTKIRTYDTNRFSSQKILEENGVDLRIENIFSQDYMKVISQEVIEYIQEPGITLVLCDGGFKIGEFNLLSEFIKPGDFIMAHDYSCNREYFEEHVNRKIWNWIEIEDTNIENASSVFNLVPFMPSEFQEAVWVCKRKQQK